MVGVLSKDEGGFPGLYRQGRPTGRETVTVLAGSRRQGDLVCAVMV